VPQIEGFFGAGFLMLLAILCATALYLRKFHAVLIRGNGWPAFFRFGLRNAMHRPGRSLLCASLIASATFIIVSMEAFRQDPRDISLAENSGTGGYPLIAESALPVVFDPNSAEGIEALGLSALELPHKEKVRFISFRERPGDDVSCLNLYAPQEPKIFGAPSSFISSGRFSFQSSLAVTPEQKRNPWLLLESAAYGKTIPAIADANTIQYILHLSVGSELTVRGSSGTPVHLRLVAALKDSILQGELLISEANFLRYFPEQEGYRFFLLDVPQNAAEALKMPLRQAMAHWGMQIESSRDRLWAYRQVENAYLSTFQSLGALGLILGTLGLSAVLLRNVLERRQELALLRAVGYRRGVLYGIVLSENIVLLSWGLVSGTICALLAILPALLIRGASFPFLTSALILMSVWVAGTATSILAVRIAFHSPLLASLRSE
jgi:putative ABC transport system permease protein